MERNLLLGKSGHVTDARGEIGWSVKLDGSKARAIGGYNTTYSVAVRILLVEVDAELVRHFAARRYTRPEAQHRELFVTVVVFDDLTDR